MSSSDDGVAGFCVFWLGDDLDFAWFLLSGFVFFLMGFFEDFFLLLDFLRLNVVGILSPFIRKVWGFESEQDLLVRKTEGSFFAPRAF